MLRIELGKPTYSPGETVSAHVITNPAKPIQARGLFIRLACFERKIVAVDRVIDKYDLDRAAELGVPYSGTIKWRDEERDSVVFEKEAKVCGEREFSGEEYFDVTIDLPKDAAPTIEELGHDSKTIRWTLSAKLDIPFAPDANCDVEVVVEGL